MPRDVASAAQALADAFKVSSPPASARWRWGEVTAVNGDGTVDVTIAGSSVPSVIVAANVHSPVGARVRVMYFGAQAMVDASTLVDEYPDSDIGGTGTNYFYAHGGCATLMSAGTTPSAQWGTASVCTIPAGFRPKTTLYFPMAKTGTTVSDSYLQVGSDGAVTIQNWGGTQAAREYRCTATWAY